PDQRSSRKADDLRAPGGGGRHAESANMARHGCCYCPVESEWHERPKPVRLQSVVESDLCSDAYWLALCIWPSLETGSKIVSIIFLLPSYLDKNRSPFSKTRICQRSLIKWTRGQAENLLVITARV